MIKTFRGKVDDGDIITIRLGTNDGLTGYKIKKFQATPYDPTANTIEGVFKVYTIAQTAATQYIDWDDHTMIASLYLTNYDNPAYTAEQTIVYDDITFNQDIYLTFVSKFTNTYPANFYLELEQVKLSIDEAAVATLKDMRGTS